MTTLKSVTQLNPKSKLNLVEHCLRELRNPTSIAPPLPENLLASLATLEREMRDSRNQLINKAEAAKRLNKAYRQSLDWLRTRLRHAFQLVKRKAKMPDFPSSIVIAFGLKNDGAYSTLIAKLPEPIQTARDMIQAEVTAMEQGFNVLTDPSAHELEALAVEAERLEALRSLALSEEDICRQRMKEVTAACDQTMRQVQNYMRFAMTGTDKDRLRKVMQALGFTYVNNTSNSETNNTDDSNTDDVATSVDTAEPDFASAPDEGSDEESAINAAVNLPETTLRSTEPSPAQTLTQTETDFFADVFAANNEEDEEADQPASAFEANQSAA